MQLEADEDRIPESIPEEDFGLDPVSVPESVRKPEVDKGDPLLDLESALEKIPIALREEMQELLRADFREVVRWKV